MNPQDLLKKIPSLWVLLAIILIGVMFFTSDYGLKVRAWLIGNPCPATICDPQTKLCTPSKMFYDEVAQKCVVSPAYVSCDTTSYFDGKGCKTSNFFMLLFAVLLIFIASLVLNRNKETKWYYWTDCARFAFEKMTLPASWRFSFAEDVLSSVKFTHKILAHDAWLLIMVVDGAEYSVLIAGTDQSGWVLHSWKGALNTRQIQKLEEKSIDLEKALQEVNRVYVKTKQSMDRLTEDNEESVQ